jgi:hypothetical protein
MGSYKIWFRIVHGSNWVDPSFSKKPLIKWCQVLFGKNKCLKIFYFLKKWNYFTNFIKSNVKLINQYICNLSIANNNYDTQITYNIYNT